MATAKDMRVVRLPALPAAELAAISGSALDRPLVHAAELVVGVPCDEAVVLGSMQRLGELAGADVHASMQVVRRGSCGAEAAVGPGTVWVQLALSHPGALVACEPGRLLNRHVRPLLRALTRVGALAHYFDRDWVSASRPSANPCRAPVAQVAFAHDATTGRALVEAVIAVSTPFALRARGSFLGKAPLTLRALGVDPDVDVGRVADAVIDAYASAYGLGELALDTASEMTRALARDVAGELDDPRSEPPWAATRDEAIGVVAAGRDRHGRVRIGGELMVSRDALVRLESEIAAASSEGAIDGARIDRAVDALAGQGVAILGVRSLRSVRDVIDEALASPLPATVR
jgi:hypothetical protein